MACQQINIFKYSLPLDGKGNIEIGLKGAARLLSKYSS
jgi:hypothetical protein